MTTEIAVFQLCMMSLRITDVTIPIPQYRTGIVTALWRIIDYIRKSKNDVDHFYYCSCKFAAISAFRKQNNWERVDFKKLYTPGLKKIQNRFNGFR